MNPTASTPQDYGHPDNNPDVDPMSKSAERDKPADPRLDPKVGEDPGLNKRDGTEPHEANDDDEPASLE